ncbi:MAG: DNA repair protein RecN [Eubacteriales bacterium]|nr:DNA repair protein RecN [Eubacteriales bacterium]
MLTDLHVKNLALIDETEVSFGPGLNILTGETGAGKSILIGSINLALGQKASREMMRKGSDSCLVEMVFQVDNPAVRRKLEEMEVETEDGQIILTRKITGGRSICRLNGETCTAARIRQISGLLLDIHGQHEHQSLLYPERQLEILDSYGKDRLETLLEETAAAYRTYSKVQRERKKFEIDESERERELAFLQFEINEIEEAGLRKGEDEELEKTYRRMSNSKSIAETLNLVHYLTGDGDGAGDRIGRAVQEMAGIVHLDEGLEELHRSLSDIDGLLNDFNREAADYLDSFSFSDEEFFETEKRLDLVNHLKSKYGKTIEAVQAYLEEQKEKLAEMENFDLRRAETEAAFKKAEEELESVCSRLSEERQKAAAELAQEIRQGLSELNFLSVEFEIRFSRAGHYSAKGFDELEFLISTNPGESVRPLAKVVSGGELSRIMLAIKTILADKDETETLIFDEIDTGISGRTAQMVSEKMARIGRNHQVLCITHLAQIASMADHHFEITKQVENGETTSHIHELDGNASVQELARILGGAEITRSVLDSAEEMKALAEKRKTEL